MDQAQIQRQQERLEEMKHRIVREESRIGDAVTEDTAAPGDLSSSPTHNADRDEEGVIKEIALDQTESQLLNQVNAALERIADGSYGKCENCGEEISDERLDALPYTAVCIACERELEKSP